MSFIDDMKQLAPVYSLDGQEMIPGLQAGQGVLIPLQLANESSLHVYAATITQAGTDAPTALLLANTIGEAVWSYVSSGVFRLTLTGAFPAGRTIYNPAYFTRISDDVMELNTGGAVTDYPVKIEVYQFAIMPAPTNFAATVIDDVEIDLDWDTVTGADGYIVEAQNPTYLQIYDDTTNAAVSDGLASDTEYTYRVKAYKAGYIDSDWVYVTATTSVT